MRKPNLVMLLSCGAFLRASLLSAQACLGLPSFTTHPVHANIAGQFPDSATSYLAGVGAGGDNGLFANLGFGQVSYEGFTEKSKLGFLEFGVQIPVGRVQLCPIAGGYLAYGPDEPDDSFLVTTHAAVGGASIGLPLDIGSLRVIPRAAVTYDYVSQRVEEVDVGSLTESSNSGVVDVGVGLVFFDRLGVQPIARLPFTGVVDEVSYGFLASFSFGWPPTGFASRAR